MFIYGERDGQEFAADVWNPEDVPPNTKEAKLQNSAGHEIIVQVKKGGMPEILWHNLHTARSHRQMWQGTPKRWIGLCVRYDKDAGAFKTGY